MIPYIFLTGFLGSGKTTLLNHLLRCYSDRKTGVIVNDFGELGIDTALVDPAPGASTVRELKAGQIFCSCLSGSFVDAVTAYGDIQPDLLIVECSGLAKPSGLKDIVRAIDLEAPGTFSYGGMVCLVDGKRHLMLEKSLMVLSEQMEASDLLLVTKTDLLENSAKEELLAHLSDHYPDKPILSASHGKFEGDLISLLKKKNDAYRSVKADDYAGWGTLGRPKTFVFHPPAGTAHSMRHSLFPFLGRLYRIKGGVETTDRGPVYFDGTSAGIELKQPRRHMAPGLVVITHDDGLEQELNFCLAGDPLPEAPTEKWAIPETAYTTSTNRLFWTPFKGNETSPL